MTHVFELLALISRNSDSWWPARLLLHKLWRSIRPMPHHIAHQVHEKFKIFSGELAPDGTIGKLADEIAAFATRAKIAPKSIGVAYLEPSRHLILTLGYRIDEDPYAINSSAFVLARPRSKEATSAPSKTRSPKPPPNTAISSATNFM